MENCPYSEKPSSEQTEERAAERTEDGTKNEAERNGMERRMSSAV